MGHGRVGRDNFAIFMDDEYISYVEASPCLDAWLQRGRKIQDKAIRHSRLWENIYTIQHTHL